MVRRFLTHSTAIAIAMIILVLVGCRAAGEPGAAAQDASPSAAAATEPLPTLLPTQVVESTIPVQPTPLATQMVASTIPAQSSPTATVTLAPTAQEEATTTPTSTPTAAAMVTATRPAPGVVVTSEPRVDVWTYGTGVVSTQIEGPLQTTIAFLNSLIMDGSGNSSLPYLDQEYHADALASPNDNLVLGIDVTYTSFEVNWLGSSGATSQVEAVLFYEGGGQATHHFDLRRSGEAWQITRVAAR